MLVQVTSASGRTVRTDAVDIARRVPITRSAGSRAPSVLVAAVWVVALVRAALVRRIERVGPGLHELELVALHGALLVRGHRRLLAGEAEGLADLAADLHRVVAAERIGRHVEVLALLRARRPAVLRMALGAPLVEHGLRVLERRLLRRE